MKEVKVAGRRFVMSHLKRGLSNDKMTQIVPTVPTVPMMRPKMRPTMRPILKFLVWNMLGWASLLPSTVLLPVALLLCESAISVGM